MNHCSLYAVLSCRHGTQIVFLRAVSLTARCRTECPERGLMHVECLSDCMSSDFRFASREGPPVRVGAGAVAPALV